MTSDWLSMKSYIFIFDDIERCDCPINELFGFINGLVEHEGAKVILVAYEKEISTQEKIVQKELQYSVVLNDKIKWPIKDTGTLYRHNDTENKMNIEVLEERRKILFPSEEVDAEYERIREKLIGVKLSYKPDIKKIMKILINESDTDCHLKENLLDNMDSFYLVMETYIHHNLRTFQFFYQRYVICISSLISLILKISIKKICCILLLKTALDGLFNSKGIYQFRQIVGEELRMKPERSLRR